jgi:ElaB/YqjD/DUF883 family membrane-anchored ribosome-binding protein
MEHSPQPSFLAELDRRQNEVISELDRLNEAIEQVLEDWNRTSEAELAAVDSGEEGTLELVSA